MTATSTMCCRPRVALAAAAFGALTLGGIHADAIAQTRPPRPTSPFAIAPTVPADVPGGAQNADIATAAAFAWREFFALNWPALRGVRETPDTKLPFGQNAVAGGPPLVWETMRHKVEIFPAREPDNISARFPAPQGFNARLPSFGYDAPPAYFYVPAEVGSVDGSVAACPGQTPVAQPAFVNLDETTQIGLDQMYAGVLPANAPGPNSAPQLIRFMAKGNRAQYIYVLQRDYWYHSPSLALAEQNFKTAVASNRPPVQPVVFFPHGTIEVKSAWRPLAPGEDASRYHTTTVRFYETNNNLPCYFEAQWALLALHIIHKTPTAPAFVFATFEQADNILAPDGKPVEDADGRIINPQPGAPTEPELTYTDSPTFPHVSVVGGTYCGDTGKRLFFHDIPGNVSLPTGGDICVKQRYHAIPPVIVDANATAHLAIAAYETANHVANSPWRYYKLVNVQAFPFDKSEIDPPSNPNGRHNAATFFQANGVVETDFTLQNFSGRLSGGASTDFPAGGVLPNFKNTHLFSERPAMVHAFNMGGCQGCHANAQLGGTDFSFILDGNGFQPAPDTAGPETAIAAAAKYKRRFLQLK
ncbi:hypothetical protein [Methylocapsa aurea]|uniref:hypothetical protein n=1 Tax=Methylocapsa aurea TaxID=663610 RepID=UPI00068D739D|nr:hypothetical protein [Methylocapsa aurea]